MKEINQVPPHAVEIESAILGALILERYAFAMNPVKPEWFYVSEHQVVAQSVMDLHHSGKPVDLMQVTFLLRAVGKLDEIGGPTFLTSLVNRVASAANLKHHIRILHELYLRRQLAQASLGLYASSFDLSVDIAEIIENVQQAALGALDFEENEVVNIGESIDEVVERAYRNREGHQLTGIGTGLQKLDKFTNGMQPGDLIIIAGETSQGKTALALTILKNAVYRFGARAAVYSLEMTHAQLTARILAVETGIPAKKILSGFLSNSEFEKIELFRNTNIQQSIFYNGRSSNSIDNICNSIRRLKIKHNINLVVVDFLQIVSANEKKSDEAKLAEIVRKLKNVAKELGIVVIALSQLSRNNDQPKPTIARLRGSGQIEEAADLVLLVYRPEVYGRSYSDPFEKESTSGTAQLTIAKGRNVGTGTFLVNFNSETTGFFDYLPTRIENNPDAFTEPQLNFM